MRIASAESEKEEVKRQLHDMKLERDQLTSEVETLRLKLMEFARSHDEQEAHPEVERNKGQLDMALQQGGANMEEVHVCMTQSVLSHGFPSLGLSDTKISYHDRY